MFFCYVLFETTFHVARYLGAVVGHNHYDDSKSVASNDIVAFEWRVGTDPLHIEVVMPMCKNMLRRGVPLPQRDGTTDALQFGARATTAANERATAIRNAFGIGEVPVACRCVFALARWMLCFNC